MRLLTHTDLDGLMCAVLLIDTEDVDEVKFIDPATIQSGKMSIFKYDIIADLPFDKRCGMWFDHHESSCPPAERKFEGSWKLAPSAARVVYEYYENPYLEKYLPALSETDRIDSGQVRLDEVKNQQGWFLLSNILEMEPDKSKDDEFRRHVIELVRKNPAVASVLADAEVAKRCERLKVEFAKFEEILKENTVMDGKVAYSDLRKKSDLPRGSNYLVYALFPDAVTSVRLMPELEEKGAVKLSVGHNVFGKSKCPFDVGAAMKRLGGGGHRAVGGAKVKSEEAEAVAKILIREINAACGV